MNLERNFAHLIWVKMKDQLRKGQRIIDYAAIVKGIHEGNPFPDEFEIWLWNLSDEEFDKVMKWKMK